MNPALVQAEQLELPRAEVLTLNAFYAVCWVSWSSTEQLNVYYVRGDRLECDPVERRKVRRIRMMDGGSTGTPVDVLRAA